MNLFGLALSATLVAQGFPSAPDRTFQTLHSPGGTYTAELTGRRDDCVPSRFCQTETTLNVRAGDRDVVLSESVWYGDGFAGGFANAFPYRHWQDDKTLVLSPWPINENIRGVRFLIHNGSGLSVDFLRLSAERTFVSVDMKVDEVRRIDDAPLTQGRSIVLDAVVGGRRLPGHAIELADSDFDADRTVCVFVSDRRLRVRDAGHQGDCAPSSVLRATAPLHFIAR